MAAATVLTEFGVMFGGGPVYVRAVARMDRVAVEVLWGARNPSKVESDELRTIVMDALRPWMAPGVVAVPRQGWYRGQEQKVRGQASMEKFLEEGGDGEGEGGPVQ